MFLKIGMKPGCYCLLFVPIDMFEEWYVTFSQCGFATMSKPYIVSYDDKTVLKRGTTQNNFPQNMSEFALVAKAPGSHPSGFLANFDTQNNLIQTNSSRRTSTIDSDPFVKHKLTRPK